MNEDDLEVSDIALHTFMGWFAHPIYVNGDYPQIMKELVANASSAQGLPKSRLPEFTVQEQARIAGNNNNNNN